MSRNYKKEYKKWKEEGKEVVKGLRLPFGVKEQFVKKLKLEDSNVNSKIKEWIEDYLIQ